MKALALLLLSVLGAQLQWRLKRIAGGLALLIASLFIAVAAVITALVGLFFALADKDAFVSPSLITALIAFLIAALLGIEGSRLMRKRRR